MLLCRVRRFSLISLFKSAKLVAIVVGALLATPHALHAQDAISEWTEMARVCENVISQQSSRPIGGFEAAPFAAGKPGLKEYAVYSKSRALVLIARVEHEVWSFCRIREVNQTDRQHWREIAPVWESEFGALFPEPTYTWVKTPYNPRQPFTGAILCKDGRIDLMVMPYLKGSFFFELYVEKGVPSSRDQACGTAQG